MGLAFNVSLRHHAPSSSTACSIVCASGHGALPPLVTMITCSTRIPSAAMLVPRPPSAASALAYSLSPRVRLARKRFYLALCVRPKPRPGRISTFLARRSAEADLASCASPARRGQGARPWRVPIYVRSSSDKKRKDQKGNAGAGAVSSAPTPQHAWLK